MKNRKVFAYFIAILLLLNSLSIVLIADETIAIPNPTSEFYVNDFADVLDSQTESRIVEIGKEMYNKTDGGQIVFVSVKTLDNYTIEEYANALFNKWGIGKNDKGVLFIISMDERKSRIEVGYGYEGDLTDLESNKLLKRFAEISSSQGINEGVLTTYSAIYSTILGENVGTENIYTNEGQRRTVNPILIIIGIIFVILDIIFNRGRLTFLMIRMAGRGGGRGGFGGGGSHGGGGRSGGGGSSGGF